MHLFFVLAVASSLAQQYALSPYGMDLQRHLDQILERPGARDSSFLLANAEGLISLGGYFSLYCWGAALGFLVQVHMGASPTKLKWLATQTKESWYVCFIIIINRATQFCRKNVGKLP